MQVLCARNPTWSGEGTSPQSVSSSRGSTFSPVKQLGGISWRSNSTGKKNSVLIPVFQDPLLWHLSHPPSRFSYLCAGTSTVTTSIHPNKCYLLQTDSWKNKIAQTTQNVQNVVSKALKAQQCILIPIKTLAQGSH